MEKSESIKELASALAKAQAAMETAKKQNTNPHFKSRYADLTSVWDACREPLTSNGLSVVQSPRTSWHEGHCVVEVMTMLLHVSGEWMSDVLAVPVSKPDAQGIGSATTYARRYALSGFAGVTADDDDGNAAVGGVPKAEKPSGYDEFRSSLEAAQDLESLKQLFSSAPKSMRDYATSADRQWLEGLKKGRAK